MKPPDTNDQVAKAPHPRPNKSKEVAPPRVLIVDDAPENLDILIACLSESGLQISVALSGEKAIQLAAKLDIDAILLDVVMPGISGYETCRRLKASKQTRDIPVIFLSARSDTFDKVKGFQVGGVDYITKPLQREEVLARLQAHLTIARQRSELKKMTIQLRAAAREDPLTGLLNRRGMWERLDSARARQTRTSEPFSVLLLDIDHFKRFNDEWGHACGDAILEHLATQLQKSVRQIDSVARWGGEEFLILLSQTGAETLHKASARIHASISATPASFEGRLHTITVTVGATNHLNGQSIDRLLQRCDEALYQGKAKGRNQIVVKQSGN